MLDKWTERVRGKTIDYVRYGYPEHLNARQTINKTTFQDLECGEKVFILHLEEQSHISRLDLD